MAGMADPALSTHRRGPAIGANAQRPHLGVMLSVLGISHPFFKWGEMKNKQSTKLCLSTCESNRTHQPLGIKVIARTIRAKASGLKRVH